MNKSVSFVCFTEEEKTALFDLLKEQKVQTNVYGTLYINNECIGRLMPIGLEEAHTIYEQPTGTTGWAIVFY